MVETANLTKKQHISVVVPCYNEVDNVPELLMDLSKIASQYEFFEVLLIDDGSTDGTYEKAAELKNNYPFLKIYHHLRNFGLTIALNTGFHNCKGDIIVFWPGDLQYKAKDLPKLTAALTDEVHMVCGNKEGNYEKKFISKIYNVLTQKMFNIKVKDQNSVKAFKREILESMRLRSSWHRYIVAIASFYGYSIIEVPITVYPRLHGKSKFSSWTRILVGILDLISVKIELDFALRPMILLGFPGIVCISTAIFFSVGSYALKHTFDLSPEYKIIWLLFIITLFFVGIILFCFGIICDVLKGIIDSQSK